MGHSGDVCDQRLNYEVMKDWNGTEQVVLRVPGGASATHSRLVRTGDMLFHGEMRRGKNSCSLAASFEFHLRVSLGMNGDLKLISRIRNSDEKPFTFSFAYHTHFLVSDISEVRIEGLETLDYLDNLCKCERFTEQGDAITFESEVDRVYLASPNVIAVLDHEKKRTFVIRKEGLPDVVVWNPWEKKAKSMVDFGDQEYKQMLCVDGAVIERPITLKPGEEWMGRLELSSVPSSYCSDHLDLL